MLQVTTLQHYNCRSCNKRIICNEYLMIVIKERLEFDGIVVKKVKSIQK